MKNLKWGNKLVYTLTSAGARKYWAVEGGEPPVPVLGNSFTAVFNQNMSVFPSYGFVFNELAEEFVKEPINSTTCKYIIPESFIGEQISLQSTFEDSNKLLSVDFTDMDTSLIIDMLYAFYGASALKTIIGLNLDGATHNDNSLADMFMECTALKDLDIKNIHKTLNLSYANLEREVVVSIFNNLIPPPTTYKPRVTLSGYSITKITSEDEKIATDKGWRVSFDVH